jgi:hypothetical protein
VVQRDLFPSGDLTSMIIAPSGFCFIEVDLCVMAMHFVVAKSRARYSGAQRMCKYGMK